MSLQHDITIECGADFFLSFLVRDGTNALVDLTGAVIEAHLREYSEASDYFAFTAVHNNGGGRITLTMPHEDTAEIGYTSGVYDVYVTQNGTRTKRLYGDVTIVPEVTKPVAGEVMYLLSFGSEDDFPTAGITRRIYFSHASNKMYRWNGTNYAGIVTDGEAATVEVGTVTTLDAGEDATVENVGSETNAVFNFGIPKGDPGTTSWDDLENKPDDFPPSAHNHDDRYYTEGETDTLLSSKANTADLGGMATVNDASSDGKVYARKDGAWYDTDDRYYTESEVEVKLGDKANSNHSHGRIDSNGYCSGSVMIANGDKFLVSDASDNKKVGNSYYAFDGSSTNKALSQKGTFEEYSQPGHSHTVSDVTDFPTLGDLADHDTVDYETEITNLPTLGTLSAEDDADSDGKQYGRKNGGWEDLAPTLDAKADIIECSASGSLVTVTDADAQNAVALSVGVDPVQDLNGYTKPWADGGNLSAPSEESAFHTQGTKLFADSGGTITQTATGWSYSNNAATGISVYIGYFTAGTVFTIKGTSNCNLYRLLRTSTKVTDTDMNASIVASVGNNDGHWTFTADANGYFYAAYYQSDRTNQPWTIDDFVVGEGPYSNICPITGHTQVTVSHSGEDTSDPETVTISFGSTIYGGTLNVKTGVLTITDENIASYAGETLPGSWISDRDEYIEGETPTTGAQVVYKLATPTTIQLTAHQEEMLKGINNIWADTGDTALTYRADTKLYIERLTKPTEDDMIANANIASGKYFMVGNSLYLSTASIAMGETIEPGTNCTALSLADALNNLS